jgi:hypothetical protein
MPNPRYFTSERATDELLEKLGLAKKVYLKNLNLFCKRYCLDSSDFKKVENIFLIGSHAEEEKWSNKTDDLDLKIVNSSVISDYLLRYKREILDPKLHIGEKPNWIDLFFARELYQVFEPRYELIDYWNKI